MLLETIPHLRPVGKWLGPAPVQTPVGPAAAYRLEQLCVLSAVESPEGYPEYHVSVSCLQMDFSRRVATDEEMERVRSAFGCGGAEEDNHGAGIVRHLWLRVGSTKQDPCPCKQDEERIVEGDRVRFEERL